MSKLKNNIQDRLQKIDKDLLWISQETFIPLRELEQWLLDDRILPDDYIDLISYVLVNKEMDSNTVISLDEKESADITRAMKDSGCETIADLLNLAAEEHNQQNPNHEKEWQEKVERLEKLKSSLKKNTNKHSDLS